MVFLKFIFLILWINTGRSSWLQHWKPKWKTGDATLIFIFTGQRDQGTFIIKWGNRVKRTRASTLENQDKHEQTREFIGVFATEDKVM